ncbi:hypothetical protein J6590_045557 [Homalodisca vitripennis]|nr:hypothetical protein J6590_045557 [Homalodisca vitripennis]
MSVSQVAAQLVHISVHSALRTNRFVSYLHGFESRPDNVEASYRAVPTERLLLEREMRGESAQIKNTLVCGAQVEVMHNHHTLQHSAEGSPPTTILHLTSSVKRGLRLKKGRATKLKDTATDKKINKNMTAYHRGLLADTEIRVNQSL